MSSTDLPILSPLIDPPAPGQQQKFLLSTRWRFALDDMNTRVEARSPQADISLTGQAASIGITSLVAAASGRYRVSWYVRVMQAATTSSSIAVTITTTDGTIVVPQAGGSVTGNTTASALSGSFIVQADAGVPISYSTAYASVGGVVMKYSLQIVAEPL